MFEKYQQLGAYHYEWYATNHTGYRDLVDFSLNHFPNRGKILDVGCGDGLISYKLFEKGLSVIGIDTNEYAIELARKASEKIYGENFIKHRLVSTLVSLGIYTNEKVRRYSQGNLQFQVQSIYDLPERDYFDFVLCHDVIEHVEFPEKLLEKTHTCMKKYAIISTPNGAHKVPKKYDYQLWTLEEFEELLSAYRYEILHIDDSKIYVKMLK